MIDPFMAAHGQSDGALSDGDRAALVQSALRFLRAGGVVPWHTWTVFSSDSRAIFDEAGAALWRERVEVLADVFADRWKRGAEDAIAALQGADEAAAEDAITPILADVMGKTGGLRT